MGSLHARKQNINSKHNILQECFWALLTSQRHFVMACENDLGRQKKSHILDNYLIKYISVHRRWKVWEVFWKGSPPQISGV